MVTVGDKNYIKCPWCGGADLYLKETMELIEPIGYKVKCCTCFACGPLGKDKFEAAELFEKGPKFIKENETKAILIGKSK